MDYGVLCLIPIITLFTLVLTTKRVLLSVGCATVMGAIVIGGTGFTGEWINLIYAAIAGPSTGFLILLIVSFGILINLLEVSGGVTDFAKYLSRFANTRKKSLFLTLILGLIIFIDDSLNNLAIATSMKKITDSYGVPRTLLGYIVNSTAAPICILVPLSTWAVFYGGLFEANGVTVNGSGMGAYIAAIPYMFFGWVTPIVVALVIAGVIPLMGITKEHNRLAMEKGIVIPEGVGINPEPLYAENLQDGNEEKKVSPWGFIIPMSVLIAVTLLTGIDVVKGCMAAILTVSVLILFKKILTLTGLFDAIFDGVKSMIFLYVQITLIMALVEINGRLGLTDFVISVAEPILVASILPAVVFAVCATYSYFGGGFWDMAMIMMPIVIPLANIFDVSPIIAGAALISATAFGSNTYVCGDAIMITSQTVGIKPIYQMLGTIPYALISAIISFILFLVVGFVM